MISRKSFDGVKISHFSRLNQGYPVVIEVHLIRDKKLKVLGHISIRVIFKFV